MLFSLIQYPGLSLLFGIHFNSFTAPVFLTFLTSLIGALLLIFFFNGKLHVPTEEEKEPKPKDSDDIKSTHYEYTTSTSDNASSTSVSIAEAGVPGSDVKYDKIAAAVLIFVKITQEINLLVLTS